MTVEIEGFGEAKEELSSEKLGMIQESVLAGVEVGLDREMQQ